MIFRDELCLGNTHFRCWNEVENESFGEWLVEIWGGDIHEIGVKMLISMVILILRSRNESVLDMFGDRLEGLWGSDI